MITAADNTGHTSRYTYDADGRRTRRETAGGGEEWQIYGFDGELLAEYHASSPASPVREYGYRNGQLLITPEPSSQLPINVALASNGATASASSSYSGFAPLVQSTATVKDCLSRRTDTGLLLIRDFRRGWKCSSMGAKPLLRLMLLRHRTITKRQSNPPNPPPSPSMV
jgi:YD repeat-containing protein